MLVYKKNTKKIIEELNSNIEKGLNIEEASKRKEIYGLNELQGKKKQSIFVKFL